MIYYDQIGHMISDTSEDELHVFAKKIGLKREWYQHGGTGKAHYDLTTSRAKNRASAAGAKMIDARVLVKMMPFYREGAEG